MTAESGELGDEEKLRQIIELNKTTTPPHVEWTVVSVNTPEINQKDSDFTPTNAINLSSLSSGDQIIIHGLEHASAAYRIEILDENKLRVWAYGRNDIALESDRSSICSVITETNPFLYYPGTLMKPSFLGPNNDVRLAMPYFSFEDGVLKPPQGNGWVGLAAAIHLKKASPVTG